MDTQTDIETLTRRDIIRHVAAVSTITFPLLAIIDAVFFIFTNSSNPDYMTTGTVISWGSTFTILAALSIAAALVTYFTSDKASTPA